MATTNAGAVKIAALIESGMTGYIGVGNSGTAFSAAQTDLLGTNLRKVASLVRTSNTLTYTATFGTSEANFAWLEIGLFDAVAAGNMLSRKVIALPTKTSSESWTINLEALVAAA